MDISTEIAHLMKYGSTEEIKAYFDKLLYHSWVLTWLKIAISTKQGCLMNSPHSFCFQSPVRPLYSEQIQYFCSVDKSGVLLLSLPAYGILSSIDRVLRGRKE